MSLAQYSQDSIVRTVFSGRHCYDSILWTSLLGHYSQDNIVRPSRSKSNTKRAFLFKRKSPQHDQRRLGRGEPLWQTLFFFNALPVLVMEGFHFLPWSNGKAMNLVPLGVPKRTPFWTPKSIQNLLILGPQNGT